MITARIANWKIDAITPTFEQMTMGYGNQQHAVTITLHVDPTDTTRLEQVLGGGVLHIEDDEFKAAIKAAQNA